MPLSRFGLDIPDGYIIFHEIDESADPPVNRAVTAGELQKRLDVSRARLREVFEWGEDFGRMNLPVETDVAFDARMKDDVE